MTDEIENCGCGHDVGPHVLVGTETDTVGGTEVPVSGIMFCPKCPCVATWAAQGYPEPEMPHPDVVEQIRQVVSGG